MTRPVIAKHYSGFRTTHNSDGKYRRCWRLLADGTIERTNSRGKYQLHSARETIPAAILAAARERGIVLRPGRRLPS